MYVQMCYVPYVATFYSISKRERYQWCLYVMLCREQVLYCSRDCFFTVFQQTLSHPAYSVSAGFLCVALWRWLDVWFTGFATVPLSASSSSRSVRLVMAHPSKYSPSVWNILLLSVYEMSCVYDSASQRSASLGSEIIVDPAACYC